MANGVNSPGVLCIEGVPKHLYGGEVTPQDSSQAIFSTSTRLFVCLVKKWEELLVTRLGI